jgi:hypothetical protein
MRGEDAGGAFRRPFPGDELVGLVGDAGSGGVGVVGEEVVDVACQSGCRDVVGVVSWPSIGGEVRLLSRGRLVDDATLCRSSSDMSGVPDSLEAVPQMMWLAQLSAAIALIAALHTLTATLSGACTVLPDSTSGVSLAASSGEGSACAPVLYRDRAPVTAAAMTIPFLRVCRTLVSSYSKKGSLLRTRRLECSRHRQNSSSTIDVTIR